MGERKRLHVDRYRSEVFAPGDRHEAWIHRLWPSFAPVYETRTLTPFRLANEQANLGDVALFYSDISSLAWERNRTHLRTREYDSLGFNINLTGFAQGEMGGRSFVQPPGVGIITDLTQTSRHESTGGRNISLIVPRAVASAAGLDVEALHGVTLQSHATALLTAHALQIRETLPHLTEEDGAVVGRTLLDLLVLAVTMSGRAEGAAANAQAATLLHRARQDIAHNLGSPALTVANLCRRLQVSRSTLHRAFEAEGGVQTYIRNARLDAARQALLDPGNAERIGDLAERFGFSDAAHLSRLFKARFGETPSECRMRMLSGR